MAGHYVTFSSDGEVSSGSEFMQPAQLRGPSSLDVPFTRFALYQRVSGPAEPAPVAVLHELVGQIRELIKQVQELEADILETRSTCLLQYRGVMRIVPGCRHNTWSGQHAVDDLYNKELIQDKSTQTEYYYVSRG